jgi:hypothetical protein
VYAGIAPKGSIENRCLALDWQKNHDTFELSFLSPLVLYLSERSAGWALRAVSHASLLGLLPISLFRSYP